MNTELPSFLQQTGPNAFTLTMSASAAETFMLCPAKYSWSRVTDIEAAAPRAGMNYGKAMHLLLAALYGDAPYAPERIVAEHFAANPQPELNGKGKPEWRTQARVLQAFQAYLHAYPAEDFEVLGVEEPFEVELGSFFVPLLTGMGDDLLMDADGPTVTVKFRGIRDLRVRWHDSIWVVDHKTSTEWSDLVVDEGKASFQFMGYAWVERQAAEGLRACPGVESATALRAAGVIGNYLVARAPFAEGRKPAANALPRDQFERQAYPYSDAQLDEWHDRAMALAKGIWQAWQEGEWRQHSTACAHWGRCEYYALCWETDPAYRLSAALGADYRKRTPAPFEEAE